MAPQLSVIIAAHNAAGVIGSCLEALEAQREAPPMEILVADSSTDGTDRLILQRFPGVHVLHTDEPLGVPQLRGRALAQARGAIIAVLDPFSVPSPDWAGRVIAAHASQPNLVIGGLVELYGAENRSMTHWAIYFNEYGMFMPPAARRMVRIVPGSNVSYKRACLFEDGRPREPVFWKTFVNRAAEAAGAPLLLEPQILVSLNKPIPFREFLRTRSWHGRCFAAMRDAGAGWPTRIARAAIAPLVPLVLCARWTRAFWPKRRRRVRYVATLPLQLLLFSAWAWGELLGSLMGPADTCGKLYY